MTRQSSERSRSKLLATMSSLSLGYFSAGSDRTAPFWSWRKVSSSSLIGVALKWRSLEKETTRLRLSETPAVGYENNFLRRVFEAFEHSDKIKIIEKDAASKKISETECDIINRYPTIEVQI